jgi:agarase
VHALAPTRPLLAIALCAAACAACSSDASAPGPPEPIHLAATGFFHTQQAGGRWWLVTPDGKPFYSLGVNHVTASSDTDEQTGQCPYCEAVAKDYPSTQAWVDATVKRLQGWGFNTVGAWSDDTTLGKQMPYTVLLDIGSGAADYFDPAFEARCAQVATSTVAARKDDRNLVGWFLDNELHWGPDWKSSDTLLTTYEALPAGSPGRLVADAHAGDPRGFLSALAQQYFKVTTTAVRAADPHHMILGVRIISVLAPPEVVSAAGQWVDVMSVNNYEYNAGLPEELAKIFAPVMSTENWLADFYAQCHKPLLFSEFSYRAKDSGSPNTYPPVFPVLATQSDRADAYAAYTQSSFAAPYVVGTHWFEFTDEPAGGRFDGENSNFGLVSTSDVPWTTLVDRMTEVAASAPDRVVKTD